MKINQDKTTKITNSKTNISTIIMILIAITLLIVISIIILMFTLKSNRMSLVINGEIVSYTDDTFLFTEDEEAVYVSIKDIAPLLGYDVHNRRLYIKFRK